MTSRDYTVLSLVYFGIIFGFACLMQWASFMQPFRDWCNANDTATGLIIIGFCLPIGFLLYRGAKVWQREQQEWWDSN